ncbi:MAG TPA: phosphoribosyltransferase family protein [Candidatus Limnocylindrales bacterium]|nr:phosphoribosyltransferase family protein [Candidatus Limnocylindrales bacterium]
MLFRDREDAGHQLAARLYAYRGAADASVLGIPRGGIVVGATLAHDLDLPLGVCPVHKLSAPSNPELAIGAVDETGATIIDWPLVRRLNVSDRALAAEVARRQHELQRWVRDVGGEHDRPAPAITILVDDGIATGATARAAVQAMRRQGGERLVLAVPVAPVETAALLAPLVEEWVCLKTPDPFFAVGNFFDSWPEVTDQEVQALLVTSR